MSRQNDRDLVRTIMATAGVKYTHARRLAAQERTGLPSSSVVGGSGGSKPVSLLDPVRFVGTTDYDHEPVYYTPPEPILASVLETLPGFDGTDLWPQSQDVTQVATSDRDGFRYEGRIDDLPYVAPWAHNDHVIVSGPTACGKSVFLSHVAQCAKADGSFGTPVMIDAKESAALGYDRWAASVVEELTQVTDSMTDKRSRYISYWGGPRSVVVVDEAGEIFTDHDPGDRNAGRVREMISALLLTGSHYGIQVVMATQSPKYLMGHFGVRVSFPVPTNDPRRGQVAVLSTSDTDHQIIKVPFG